MDPIHVSSIRRIRIPEGLDALLEEIIREVLKTQPKHIELFIADLVKKLIEIRNEAASGSTQASPTDVVKHIIEQERRAESETSKRVPIVSQEELSPINDSRDPNSEAAERGSVHYVEATAGRTLAASTSDLAILGVTVKYKEPVDYRRSVYSDQGYVCQSDRMTQKYEHELSVNNLPNNPPEPTSIVIEPETLTKSNNIVTTVTIEKPPIEIASCVADTVIKVQPMAEVKNSEIFLGTTQPKVAEKNEDCEKVLPKVIEVTKKETLDEIETINDPISPLSTLAETKFKLSNNPTQYDKVESPDNETEDKEVSDITNGNSEKESTSSEIISVVNKTKEEEERSAVLQKEPSFEIATSLIVCRPNRLSLGQQSIESDQNTVEISSADDVVKNESTDLTSPESLRDSIGESLAKDTVISPNADSKGDIESWKSEKDPREISNTSLNTLGDDSEEAHSELDLESSREYNRGALIRRFDTISSNGESSYRPEEHNYPSVTEVPELEEFVCNQNFILDSTNEEVFDQVEEEHRRLKESVRESARQEVDRICEQAIENVTVMMNDSAALAKETREVADDYNNVSESSLLSIVDSVVAEKGSDFDSLSLVDEQSEYSRSTNVFSIDEDKCQQRTQDVPKVQSRASSQEEAERRLQGSNQPSLEDSPISLQEVSGTVISQEDISINDTEKTTLDSVSEDLPKPPDIEDFPPLPENLDQFDITEDELKAVQLPDSEESENASNLNNPSSISLEEAASKIQAGVRGYLTRKQLKDSLKNNDPNERDSFDLPTKNYVKNKRLSLDSKLVDFENIRKLPKLKSTLSECAEEESSNIDYEKAAKKIQSTFRNYRARKSICLGDAHRKMINGGSIMRDVQNDTEKCEPTLLAEKYELSAKTFNDLEPLIEEDKKSPENIIDDDESLKQAAVKIQATYRGFRTRKSIQLSASAATKIQAHFRGYKVRKSLKRSSSLNDLRNSASSSCSNLSSQQDLEKHVTKIQAGVRGYLVRKRHSLQNVAAAKIQMNYRKYKSRKESKTKN